MSGKSSNQYAETLTAAFYEKCPKAVLAAIAVSYASRQTEEDFSKVEREIAKEWEILYKAGIVPQKPPK